MNLLAATTRALPAITATVIDAALELTDGLADAIRRTLAAIRDVLPAAGDPTETERRPWVPMNITEVGDEYLIRVNGEDCQVIGEPDVRDNPDTNWDGAPKIVDVHVRNVDTGQEELVPFAAYVRLLAVPHMTVPDDASSLSGPGYPTGAAA